MREWPTGRDRRRAKEFDAFVAGAASRLLHVSALLTTEDLALASTHRPAAHPDAHRPTSAAQELLLHALARTYAAWGSAYDEDPYALARRELVTHFARTTWRHRSPRGGVLSPLAPQERLVTVLRLHEGLAEEQVAALLGLSTERVRAVCARAVAAVRRLPAQSAGRTEEVRHS